MTLRIGLIGFGALGSLAFAHAAAAAGRCVVSGLLARGRKAEHPAGLEVRTGLEEFLALNHDVVIECAGQAALREHGRAVLAAGVDLVPASVGALVDDELREALREAAARAGRAVRIPSGAIVGIDGLAAARHGGIDEVLYRGTMPPHVLRPSEGASVPGQRTLVYEGSARAAIAQFPKNVNLTATIALAGVGFDRTRVELLVDPAVEDNVHELHVRGAFGSYSARVCGRRIQPSSPSSRLVAGSLLEAALGRACAVLGKV